jgi:hypothetical protein
MQRGLGISLAGGLMMILSTVSARGQLASPPSQQRPATAPSQVQGTDLGFDVSLSPRVWFTTEGIKSGSSIPGTPSESNPSTATHSTDLTYPMFGVSAAVVPHAMQDWPYPVDFTFTAIGGSGEGHQTTVGFGGPTSGGMGTGFVLQDTVRQQRIDFEALGRLSLSDFTKLVLGPRFFYSGQTYQYSTGTVVNLPQYFFIPELGLQFIAPISSDGTHSLFGGAVAGFGYDWAHQENSAGPATTGLNGFVGFLDVNAGYQYKVNENLLGYVRFRSQFAAQTSGGPLLERVAIKYGPEIALTIRF